jgi:hypothetical protein
VNPFSFIILSGYSIIEYKAIKKGFFMKKHFIIMAVLLTNILSMQAIMTVAGRAVAGLKRVPTRTGQPCRYVQTGPEKRYYANDIVNKSEEMEQKHGFLLGYYLQHLSFLDFDNTTQMMKYLELVDIYASNKMKNIPSSSQFVHHSRQQEKE